MFGVLSGEDEAAPLEEAWLHIEDLRLRLDRFYRTTAHVSVGIELGTISRTSNTHRKSRADARCRANRSTSWHKSSPTAFDKLPYLFHRRLPGYGYPRFRFEFQEPPSLRFKSGIEMLHNGLLLGSLWGVVVCISKLSACTAKLLVSQMINGVFPSTTQDVASSWMDDDDMVGVVNPAVRDCNKGLSHCRLETIFPLL